MIFGPAGPNCLSIAIGVEFVVGPAEHPADIGSVEPGRTMWLVNFLFYYSLCVSKRRFPGMVQRRAFSIPSLHIWKMTFH